MSNATLAASGLIYAMSALVFFGIAFRFAKRTVSNDLRLAASMFVVFWAGTAGSIFLTGAANLLAAAGLRDVALHQAILQVSVLLLVAAALGLTHYMLVFLTGKRDLVFPLAAFYTWLLVVVFFVIDATRPTALTIDTWSASPAFSGTSSMPLLVALTVLFVGPPLVTTLMFLGASMRVQDAGRRSRMAVIAIGILAWSAGGSVSQAAKNPWLSFALGPALCALVALAWFLLLDPAQDAEAKRAVRERVERLLVR